MLHGYCAWFEAALSEDVVLSTYPPGLPSWDNLVYLLEQPVQVDSGLLIELMLRGKQVSAGSPMWQWHTTIREQSDVGDSSPILAQYRQSTFAGSYEDKDSLIRRSSNYRPALTKRGVVLFAVLSRVDGRRSLTELAANLSSEHPDLWATEQDAMNELVVLVSDNHGSGCFA